jgi:hypothetical protein
LIYDKIKEQKGCYFLRKKRRRRRNGGRKEGRAVDYNLNIINGFFDRK